LIYQGRNDFWVAMALVDSAVRAEEIKVFSSLDMWHKMLINQTSKNYKNQGTICSVPHTTAAISVYVYAEGAQTSGSQTCTPLAFANTIGSGW
jgi:hypothetical protein